MCGIAGIYNFKNICISPNEISSLTNRLAHRGPDSSGVWINNTGTLALGHRRLAILDVSASGAQPMHSLNNRYTIILNGEIYNFLELREDLKNKGFAFETETDTEVVLAAYEFWGIDMLNKFNGMWAFALYDNETSQLILSRDRYGVKPLYYFFNNDTLIFASEVQSIHKFLGFDKLSLNSSVILSIAKGSFDYHGSEDTYVEGIKSLPGGHNLTIENNNCSVHQWYKLKRRQVPKGIEKQSEELKQLLIESCKLRLRSDVPVGTCLSGGIDSGSITSIINNNKVDTPRFKSANTHRSFCVSFPDSAIDERASAEQLAKKTNAILDIITVTPPALSELEEAMRSCDGPMHSLAFFPIWKLFKYIKENGVTVTLDGQGPDEMLGGYRPLSEALWAAVELRKPWWFYDIYRTYSNQGESSHFSSKKYAKKTLFNLLLKGHKGIVWHFLNRKPVTNGIFNNSLDNSLYNQFFFSPLPGILNQYDRCSMAHGVECRMPFMDYRIVEFLFSLPVTSKVGGGYTKRVLREAVKGILPEETRLNKIKIGFNAPIVEWFMGPLKDFMLKIMNSKEFLNSDYFNGTEIKSNFVKFLNSEKPNWDIAWQFWPPVHITWWIKQNIN